MTKDVKILSCNTSVTEDEKEMLVYLNNGVNYKLIVNGNGRLVISRVKEKPVQISIDVVTYESTIS